MNIWLLLVVLSLGTFRLTVLVVKDSFPPIAKVRWWLQHLRPSVQRPVDVPAQTSCTYVRGCHVEYWWLGELVSCIWCSSAYISGGLVLMSWLLWGMPMPVFIWFAVWGAGAFLASRVV